MFESARLLAYMSRAFTVLPVEFFWSTFWTILLVLRLDGSVIDLTIISNRDFNIFQRRRNRVMHSIVDNHNNIVSFPFIFVRYSRFNDLNLTCTVFTNCGAFKNINQTNGLEFQSLISNCIFIKFNSDKTNHSDFRLTDYFVSCVGASGFE